MNWRRSRLPAGYLRARSKGGVDLPATRSRYVRFTQTSTATQTWTVADLRVYG